MILFDNRGIGESDAPPGPYTAAELAADAAQVLDEAGVERAHVLGTSLGGMVAQELALAAPERVDRLVLACTTPGGPESFPMPEQTVKLLTSGAHAAPVRRERARARARTRSSSSGSSATARRRRSRSRPGARRPPRARPSTLSTASRAIAAPTLILHGTEDAVVDSRNTTLLALRIPDARVELFPGGGHLFFWEQPERFVEVVTEFLS